MSACCRSINGLVAALLLLCLPGVAAASEGEAVQLHGFATQGLLLSSGNDYYGDSSGGSLGLTELGINASWRAASRLRLAGQLLSRRAGGMDDGDPRVDFALADLTLLSRPAGGFGVRVGRLKNPIGLYNETRDVAATRPGILLPESVYLEGLGVRDFFHSADGADLYGEWRLGRHLLAADYTRSIGLDLGDETRRAFFGGSATPGVLHMELGHVARLRYERDEGRIRLAWSDVQVRTRYHPAAVDPRGAGAHDLRIKVLSAEYNDEFWSLTAEHSRRDVSQEGFGAPLYPDASAKRGGFYLQGTYRPAEAWELFLRHDRYYNNLDDRDGARQSLLTTLQGEPQAPHRFYYKDWTVGAGWQVTPRFGLRAELHRIDGTAYVPVADNPELLAGGGEPRWSLFALQATYQF